jgi:putative glutamine amidotransferase
MPVIGLTACRKIEDYRQAVLHVGGGVHIVDASMAVGEVIDGIDGLLLTGGEDLAPARYGEAPHPSVVDVDPARDEFEIALVGEARRRNLPILGICRGIQVLNVALGGTLIQDIPGQYASEIEHAQQRAGIRKEEPGHTVRVTPGSLLARTYGAETIEVNSFHHQALRDIAPDLEINGVSPDEIVESVARPASGWMLGVQWHPEMMFRAHPEHLKPFAALVGEAAKRKDALAVGG